ncbi:hypothetical protein VTL71DRAFT_8620 [Oculimacula yallundae]|uniref:Uncharacterized protein n=1 Tax=Oculimacula yallundae TaxID=86028 RepID=A0ABR4CZA3_9HELO
MLKVKPSLATQTDFNATISAATTSRIPSCCAIDSRALRQVYWYEGSVEVTVATISTIVYKYDNTAVTQYRTIVANSSQALPTGLFEGTEVSIIGVPTDYIDAAGPYEAESTIIYGTEFTDPYGIVYTSPTRVDYYPYVVFTTFEAIYEATASEPGYKCSSERPGDSGFDVYPSGIISFRPSISFALRGLGKHSVPTHNILGFYYVGDPANGGNGEQFTTLPEELRDWLVSHTAPPSDIRYPRDIDFASCSMNYGGGIPIAHIPVMTLTGSEETTIRVAGDLSEVMTTTTAATRSTPTVTSAPVTINPTHVSTAEPNPTPIPVNQGPVVAPPPPSSSVVVTNAPDNQGVGSQTDAQVAPTAGVVGVDSTLTSTIEIGSPFAHTQVTAIGALSPNGDAYTPPSTIDTPQPTTASAIPVNSPIPIETASPPSYGPSYVEASTPILVLGSSTLTLKSDSPIVVGSQTLTPGGAVTASGQTFSLETGGATLVVVESDSTSTQGLGGIINSLGGFVGTATGNEGVNATSGPLVITSGASSCHGRWSGLLGAVLFSVSLILAV